MEKSKVTTAFSKNDSMCLKGLAIVLLMCIHCFGNNGRFSGFEFNFWPLGQELFVDLAYYCKICVSVFAFISGYGMYLSVKNKVSDINETNKWIVSRVFKILSGFWILFIIFFVFLYFFNGLPQKTYLFDGKVRGIVYILIDFLGLSELFNTPMMNGSWWYMSAAVIFVALMPLIVRWTDKLGWASLFSVLVILPRILFNSKFFGATNAFSFILPLYFGALFARFDVFEKIEKIKIFKNKILNDSFLFIGGLFIVFVSIFFWIKLPSSDFWEYHFGVAPLFPIIFCNRFIFREGNFIRKIINTVFAFLGKHSMNIFVLHTFYRANILKDFLFSMKYPILTILSLLVISLITSIVVEFIKKIIKYNKLMLWLENKILSLFPKKA